MPERNAWVDRDPFDFIARGPLMRSDYGWGGGAWTRPILPRPAVSSADLGVALAALAARLRSLPPAPNPLRVFQRDMGALLDAIEWRWPGAV